MQFLIFLLFTALLSSATGSSTASFDGASTDLESAFASNGDCEDGSISSILEGGTGNCQAFSDMNDALNISEADNNDGEEAALTAILISLLHCDNSYCDDDLQATIIIADSGDKVDTPFRLRRNLDLWEDIGDAFEDIEDAFDDILDITYEMQFSETGNNDIYGCARQTMTVVATSSLIDPVSSPTNVERSDPDCVQLVLNDVVEVLSYFDLEEKDEEEDNATSTEEDDSDTLQYIVVAFASILGFGVLGVCCLALSSSSVQAKPVKKTKSSSSKKKKTRS